jgi:Zn finger protein HypA/HybF involved in hydrogenase expression
MRTDILEKKDLILDLISKNVPKSKICKILMCKPLTLDLYLIKMEINYKGNKGAKGHKVSNSRKPALYYIDNNISITTHKLKNKLIQDNIKYHKCECCGLTEWQGTKIPIELHHIDGNSLNNKLDNLQILCPNCHAQTDNHAGKKTKKLK